MVIYVSLKIFFVNKLSTHPGKNITVVHHLQKDSGKFSWKVNGTRLFGSFQWKISGSNGTSEKVVPFFWTEYFKRKFVFHFFKAVFDTSFRPSRSFSDKWNWFVQMVNAIPGRYLPVQESWILRTIRLDREATGLLIENGKQPITHFQQFIRLLFPEWLLCTELEQNFSFIPLWSLSTVKEFVLFSIKLEISLSQHLAKP